MSADTLFWEIDNTPRDYAWGQVDGVARVRGMEGSGNREAELWLGAHPSAPSVFVGDAPWRSLDEWEQATGARLPFLLKILCAAEPLSLQAHPSTAQAEEGFARENAAGIPLDTPHRNYRDASAKPELIVALHDGFEALCGFRAVTEVLADLDALEALAPPSASAGLQRWRELLTGDDGIRRAFLWLLSGDDAIPPLVDAAVAASAADSAGVAGAAGSASVAGAAGSASAAGSANTASAVGSASVGGSASAGDQRFARLGPIATAHPGDPGILGALMLQHLTLRQGEALWLPAGNIHAYLFGAGVELMGPSDNVLRGGLTPKHIDTDELGRVLDAREGGDPRLIPVRSDDGAQVFRPNDGEGGPGFALHMTVSSGEISTPGAGIALATGGAFTLTADGESIRVPRGRAVLVTRAARLRVEGEGTLFLATGT